MEPILGSTWCWVKVANRTLCPSCPNLPEEPALLSSSYVQMWYWPWPSPFPFPTILASFHNPWFQFDFVYKVVCWYFFFLAFCFLNVFASLKPCALFLRFYGYCAEISLETHFNILLGNQASDSVLVH